MAAPAMRYFAFCVALLLFVLCADIASAQCSPPKGSQLVLTLTIRDFKSSRLKSRRGNGDAQCITAGYPGHPDFEAFQGSQRGLVRTTLGEDKKPLRADLPPKSNSYTPFITSQESFSSWYRDVESVNKRTNFDVTFNWDSSNCVYVYDNQEFYPINGAANNGFGNTCGQSKNYHFTAELHTTFRYSGNEKFRFRGDDDVWVYINNRLWVDLGGVHMAECWPPKNGDDYSCPTNNNNLSFRSLSADAQALGLVVGNVYPFDWFFAERHTVYSTVYLATSIALEPCLTIDACGVCNGNVTVDPCTGQNCNHGYCSCVGGGSCSCEAGWVSANPENQCNSYCGNSQVEPAEQCDSNSRCCIDCKFANAGTQCEDQGNQCKLNQCAGNSLTCGVNKPDGTSCNGGNPGVCKQFACLNGNCVTQNSANGTACTPTDKCSTGACDGAGVCVPTPKPCGNSTDVCNNYNCNPSTGSCVKQPVSDGTYCNTTSTDGTCFYEQCRSGSCVRVSRTGDSCGASTESGCTIKTCDGFECKTRTLSGNSCGANLDSCRAQVCSNGLCQPAAINNGGACTQYSNGTNVSTNTCNRFSCLNGQCTEYSNNDGNACTETAAPSGDDATCLTRRCSSGTCSYAPTNEGQNCKSSADSCTSHICRNGVCSVQHEQDFSLCGTQPAQCGARVCSTGVCTLVARNGGSNCTNPNPAPCRDYVCSGTDCVERLWPTGRLCDNSDLCNPGYCSATGACVSTPVDCSATGNTCSGGGVCNPATGVCQPAGEYDCVPGAGVKCCGAYETDNQCMFETTGTDCSDANADPCTEYKCNANGGCVATPVADDESCTGWYEENYETVPECRLAVCRSGKCSLASRNTATPCTGATPDTCSLARCDGSGSCHLVANNAGQACAETTANECNTGTCQGIRCVLTPRVSLNASADIECTARSETDCTVPRCNAAGNCVDVAKANGLACSLDGGDCADPVCASGRCTLSPKPTTTSCTLPTGECQLARCNGAGACGLVGNPATAGQPCPQNFGQCFDPVCHTNGTCVGAPKTAGTPCSLQTVGECQLAQCNAAGSCVLVSKADDTVCSRPIDDLSPCNEYVCSAGACAAKNLVAGTPCPDNNLCDADFCDGSNVCVHTVNVTCTQSSNSCKQTNGTCNPATGRCQFSNLQVGTSCDPGDDVVVEAGCNYRCDTGSCVPVCTRGVCGNGIVEAPFEECDWASDPPPLCCNASTCLFVPQNTWCNITESTVNLNGTEAKCYSGSCSASGVCSAVYNETISGCGGGGNNKTAIIAAVVTAGVVALAVAAVAAFVWWKKQSGLEKAWVEEYMNSAGSTVANNPAFVGSNLDVANPAFGAA